MNTFVPSKSQVGDQPCLRWFTCWYTATLSRCLACYDNCRAHLTCVTCLRSKSPPNWICSRGSNQPKYKQRHPNVCPLGVPQQYVELRQALVPPAPRAMCFEFGRHKPFTQRVRFWPSPSPNAQLQRPKALSLPPSQQET